MHEGSRTRNTRDAVHAPDGQAASSLAGLEAVIPICGRSGRKTPRIRAQRVEPTLLKPKSRNGSKMESVRHFLNCWSDPVGAGQSGGRGAVLAIV